MRKGIVIIGSREIVVTYVFVDEDTIFCNETFYTHYKSLKV